MSIIDPAKTQVKMSLAVLVVCFATIGSAAGVYFNMRAAVADAQGKADNNAATIVILAAKIDANQKEVLDRLSKLERGMARIEGALSSEHRMSGIEDVKTEIADVRLSINKREKP